MGGFVAKAKGNTGKDEAGPVESRRDSRVQVHIA